MSRRKTTPTPEAQPTDATPEAQPTDATPEAQPTDATPETTPETSPETPALEAEATPTAAQPTREHVQQVRDRARNIGRDA